jgi:hypothetical protein
MVNVNTVYQTVLQIINKEQRGYITPQEFNNIASQVQLEIFESYFPDGNQLNRQNQNNTQNDTEFFNIFKNQNEKLYPFIKDLDFTFDTNATQATWTYNPPALNFATYEAQIYWMGDILSKYDSSLIGNTDPQATSSGGEYITQLVTRSDFNKITRSKLTAPTQSFPIAYASTRTVIPLETVGLTILPQPSTVTVNCIVTPNSPTWSFQIGSRNQYIFSAGNSVNFQLSNTERTNIIIRVLKYCGIIINDPTIIDVASQETAEVQANEKS